MFDARLRSTSCARSTSGRSRRPGSRARARQSPPPAQQACTVLEWAAAEGRMVLTHDVSTFIAFDWKRVAAGQRRNATGGGGPRSDRRAATAGFPGRACSAPHVSRSLSWLSLRCTRSKGRCGSFRHLPHRIRRSPSPADHRRTSYRHSQDNVASGCRRFAAEALRQAGVAFRHPPLPSGTSVRPALLLTAVVRLA